MATLRSNILTKLTPNQIEKLEAKGVTQFRLITNFMNEDRWIVEYERNGKSLTFEIPKDNHSIDMVYMHTMRKIAENEKV